MDAASDAAFDLDMFGPVDDTPRAFTPIPYGIWKKDGPLFSLLFFKRIKFFLFSKIVVGHVCFHLVSYGGGVRGDGRCTQDGGVRNIDDPAHAF